MKREIFIPILVAILLLVFWLLCLFVFFRPKPSLVRAKLRLGALILSLTFMASCGPPRPTCYDAMPVTGIDENRDTVVTKDKDTVVSTVQQEEIPKEEIISKDTVIDRPNNNEIRCYVPPPSIKDF